MAARKLAKARAFAPGARASRLEALKREDGIWLSGWRAALKAAAELLETRAAEAEAEQNVIRFADTKRSIAAHYWDHGANLIRKLTPPVRGGL